MIHFDWVVGQKGQHDFSQSLDLVSDVFATDIVAEQLWGSLR